MNNKASFIAMVFIVSAFLSTNALAQQGVVTASVTRVLVSDPEIFGGCMIELSENIPLNCEGRWVTFSCSGTYSDKATAYHKLDTAKMAKAANKPVGVTIDDAKRHNGFCYARRIDVY